METLTEVIFACDRLTVATTDKTVALSTVNGPRSGYRLTETARDLLAPATKFDSNDRKERQ